MTKRMLIDATHAEETRVVVLDGNRLEDFDVETSTKRQLKGNIYLAKVVRVEPSLQAAFVEYGGNRHGFLAFSEIHPDYYQIPVADRQRLLALQAEEARLEEEEDDLELALTHTVRKGAEPAQATAAGAAPEPWTEAAQPPLAAAAGPPAAQEPGPEGKQQAQREVQPWATAGTPRLATAQAPVLHARPDDEEDEYDLNGEPIEAQPPPETIGGNDTDANEDHQERRIPPRFLRHYKIQEVIRRRQIMLVQVVKEERGTKGAALTTYLSLAGRFGVLMPNSPRGGGISRKITSAADRRRLREIIAELDIPDGMGLIIRTAGANRPKAEIRRDCEYLLRLWDDIRDHTLRSVAPALIYEEASLIKRAIRDVYSRDIDEILVDGEEGWRAAHEFMRQLMPAHAKKVQLWRDGGQPLFARQQVEAQLDAMLTPIVQLRSGGYLVINQAEALVAIDVNSGRSTRERNIEETALRTNLEAADEVARQLRLRDLAGLIVIDFIDMESKRHNAMVERRLKEALKNDRARIQVGHISHFGLLEMSRQRLRPSLAETSFIPCPHCGGTGHVRSTESAAIHVLRGIEDEGAKRRSAEIVVHVTTPIALYILNHKRERLREIELRYAMRVMVAADDSQIAPQYRIDKVRVRSPEEAPPVVTPDRMIAAPMVHDPEPDEDEDDEAVAEEEEDEADDEAAEEARAAEGGESAADIERRRKRRRRRRRGGRREEQAAANGLDANGLDANGLDAAQEDVPTEEAGEPEAPGPLLPEEAVAARPEGEGSDDAADPLEGPVSDEEARSRRRSRRGGRRRRRENEGEVSPFAMPGAEQPDLLPAYAGPTPADPFGQVFDIFDVMERVEREAETQPARRASVSIVNSPAPEPGAGLDEDRGSASAGSVPDAPLPLAAVADTAGEAAAGVPEVPAPAAGEDPLAASGLPAGLPAAGEDGMPAGVPHVPLPAGTPAASEAALPEPAAAPSEPSPRDPSHGEPSHGEPPPEEALTPTPSISASSTPAPSSSAPSSGEASSGEASPPEPPPTDPAVKPILVGAESAPAAEKKRGWWRR